MDAETALHHVLDGNAHKVGNPKVMDEDKHPISINEAPTRLGTIKVQKQDPKMQSRVDLRTKETPNP